MAKENKLIDNTTRPQVVITRIFDAPRSLVFSMWTNPKYLARWWGPKDFTNPVCEMDVQKGGSIKIVMQAPDGSKIPVTGIFNEILEPERIVFTTMKVDANGNTELEVVNTIILTEEHDKTKLVMTAVVIKSIPEANASIRGMEVGWNQSLDRLSETLTS